MKKILIILILLLTSSCIADWMDTSNKYQIEEIEYKGMEKDIFNLINIYREENKLSKLKTDLTATDLAEGRAIELQYGISHEGSEEEFEILFNNNADSVGEIVSFGLNTPEKIVNAWINSEQHRNRLLRRNFKGIGIGIFSDEKGTVHCCVLFIGINI